MHRVNFVQLLRKALCPGAADSNNTKPLYNKGQVTIQKYGGGGGRESLWGGTNAVILYLKDISFFYCRHEHYRD